MIIKEKCQNKFYFWLCCFPFEIYETQYIFFPARNKFPSQIWLAIQVNGQIF